METKTYAIDKPDERDWQWADLMGSTEDLPNSLVINDGECQNQ